jgi:hypothetical protein
LIVFIPRPGSTTWEIKDPETNSVMASMNKIALRKKLNRERLVAVLKNFLTEFWIHRHEIRRCTTRGTKKTNPNTSWMAKPVILGERSKRKITRSAVSRQMIYFLREEAVISLCFSDESPPSSWTIHIGKSSDSSGSFLSVVNGS